VNPGDEAQPERPKRVSHCECCRSPAPGRNRIHAVEACRRAPDAYNADNEQTKFSSASSISYDANGELKSETLNTWDARRHLTGISGGATVSFLYDAFGRRMKRTIGSSMVTQFIYDRLNPVQELNNSNGVSANLLIGLNIDEFFTRTASSTTSTLTGDCSRTIAPNRAAACAIPIVNAAGCTTRPSPSSRYSPGGRRPTTAASAPTRHFDAQKPCPE
jgi:hypothetical protein